MTLEPEVEDYIDSHPNATLEDVIEVTDVARLSETPYCFACHSWHVLACPEMLK